MSSTRKSQEDDGKANRVSPLYWAGVGLGVAAVAAIPSAMAWVFLHPPRQLHGGTPKSALGLPFQSLRLQTEDGISLGGWYVPAIAAKGVVVYCHGYTGNRTTMLPYLSILHRAGYAGVLCDFRAHGWSGGVKSTFGHREPLDLAAILEWVELQPELQGLPIVLMGESMGAAVSLLVAAVEPRIRAVIADSPFARFDSAVESRLHLTFGPAVGPFIFPHVMRAGERILGTPPEEIAPEVAIAEIAPRRVLLIHGTKDRLLPPQHSHRILEGATDNAVLWEVEGAQHAHSVDVAPEEYARRVTAFLNEALA